MPAILICNLPPIMRETLEIFTDELIDVTAYSVKELNIRRETLQCFIFNTDGLSNEEQVGTTVISVEYLEDKPERCAEKRGELADNIRALTYRYFPNLSGFECIVEPYTPKKRAAT